MGNGLPVWQTVLDGVDLVKVVAKDLFSPGDSALVRHRGMVLRKDVLEKARQLGLSECTWPEDTALREQMRVKNAENKVDTPVGIVCTACGQFTLDVHGNGRCEDDNSPNALWPQTMPLIFVQSRRKAAVPAAA